MTLWTPFSWTANVSALPLHALTPTFEHLVPDHTSRDASGASMARQRQRRFAQFHVHEGRDGLAITALADTSFAQEVADSRNASRRFELLEPRVRHSPELAALIEFGFRRAPRRRSACARVAVHQVRQIVEPNARRADNAPEGVHQDGADSIVSALVVQRVGVRGGDSLVYDPTRRRLFRGRLRAGQGLLQDDRELWHDVSQIRLAPRQTRGLRDLFGLDLIWIPCESVSAARPGAIRMPPQSLPPAPPPGS